MLNGSEDIFVWKDKENAGMCSGCRAASRLFGYANVRDNVSVSMRRGIKHALDSGSITFEGGRYRMAR